MKHGGAWRGTARLGRSRQRKVFIAHLERGVAGRGKAWPDKTTQGTFQMTKRKKTSGPSIRVTFTIPESIHKEMVKYLANANWSALVAERFKELIAKAKATPTG